MKNNVTIRVWLTDNEKMGHVSLQVGNFQGNNESFGLDPEFNSGIYVSIYPSGRGVALFDRAGNKFKTKTLEEDLEKYKKLGCTPETFIIENLDIGKIVHRYHQLIKEGFNFSKLGSSIFRDVKTQNCSGICWYLLQSGGISAQLSHYDRLRIALKQYAPSAKTVATFAIPFSIYLSYQVFSAVSLWNKGQIDSINAVEEFDKKYPIDSSQDWNSILPSRAEKFEQEYPQYKGFYYQSPASHLDALKKISETIWSLLPIEKSLGKAGFLISSAVVVSAAVYVAGSAGIGPLASFSVITPSDVREISKHISECDSSPEAEARVLPV